MTAPAKPEQTITLLNPMTENFSSFIVGNAAQCNAVVEQDSGVGQQVVICGAGPSLAATAPKWANSGDQLWGCNSALTWLETQGYTPTHGFAIDQTPHMLAEWASTPDVEYLIASTVHPHLVDLLQSKGRRTRFFHNYVGLQRPPVSWPDGNGVAQAMSYEQWLYTTLYEGTVMAGSGLNSVTRAIDVALFMGFDKITVLGADCALKVLKPRPDCDLGSPDHLRWLREDCIMHADGGNALASGATPTTIEGLIDGRMWTTKPDMIISAKFLAQMWTQHQGRVRIMGDTLPKALRGKSDAFLRRLPAIVSSDGTAIDLATPDDPTETEAA